jgi:hypothetical protein
LGIQRDPGGQGAALHWRETDDPQRTGMTVWALFEKDTKYFNPSHANFMINYRVDDLDALLDLWSRRRRSKATEKGSTGLRGV